VKRNTRGDINPSGEELAAVLKAHGVHNYSIFLHRDTRQLFAYAED
jgi:L-rhamnose mutarotase